MGSNRVHHRLVVDVLDVRRQVGNHILAESLANVVFESLGEEHGQNTLHLVGTHRRQCGQFLTGLELSSDNRRAVLKAVAQILTAVEKLDYHLAHMVTGGKGVVVILGSVAFLAGLLAKNFRSGLLRSTVRDAGQRHTDNVFHQGTRSRDHGLKVASLELLHKG